MPTSTIPVPNRFLTTEYTDILNATPSPQQLTIDPTANDVMQKAAAHGYPDEICGLLIGKSDSKGWNIVEARQVENLNQTRASDRFQLDPAAYQRIDRELRGSGTEIIGVFHSHPDCPAQPSPTDLSSAWEGFLYPIISVCAGSVADIRWWLLHKNETQYQEIMDTTTA